MFVCRLLLSVGVAKAVGQYFEQPDVYSPTNPDPSKVPLSGNQTALPSTDVTKPTYDSKGMADSLKTAKALNVREGMIDAEIGTLREDLKDVKTMKRNEQAQMADVMRRVNVLDPAALEARRLLLEKVSASQQDAAMMAAAKQGAVETPPIIILEGRRRSQPEMILLSRMLGCNPKSPSSQENFKKQFEPTLATTDTNANEDMIERLEEQKEEAAEEEEAAAAANSDLEGESEEPPDDTGDLEGEAEGEEKAVEGENAKEEV